MPYRRRTYRRRRSSRRRSPQYTTMGSAYHLAKQASKGVWYLKGLVNSELLKSDDVGSGTLATTGTVINLCTIAQGDSDANRTGNSILVRSSDLRLKLSRDISVGNATQLIRVALVMDSQQIGDTDPTHAQIYAGTGPLTHLNADSAGRFKILWSKIFTLDNVDTFVKYTKWYKKMRHHVRYNGGSGTDIQRGGLYLVMSSDQTSSGFPSYEFSHRLSYHDN